MTRRLAVAFSLFVGFAGASFAQSVDNDWQSDGSGVNPTQYQGKWEDTGHWSTGIVPGASGATDHNPGWMQNWNSQGPAISTIDATTLTTLGVASIDIRSMRSMHINQSSNIARRSRLIVTGTELAPITLNVGSLTNPPGNAISSSIRLGLELAWTNLNVIGTPTGEGLWLYRQGTDLAGLPMHVFTDTNVLMTNAAAGRGIQVGATADGFTEGARLSMTRGSMTVTNATNNARILVAGTTDLILYRPGGMWMTDAALTTNNMQVTTGAFFHLDNSNIATPSTLTGTLSVATGGTVRLDGGTVNIGTISFDSNSSATYAGLPQTITVGGGAVSATTLNMTATGTHLDGTPQIFHVDGGAVTLGNANIGGQNFTDIESYQIRLSSGSLTVANRVQLGHNVTTRYGAGMMTMTGGTFATGILSVGANGSDNTIDRADGYYNQTGGTATITDALYLRPLPASGYGTEQFVVAGPGVMEFNGTGMVKSGGIAWSASLLTTENLDFSGTLRFAPGVGVTAQNLLMFGEDFGSGIGMASMVAGNYGVGTLDLTALEAAGATLTVTPAGNLNPNNALYIHNLLGVTADNATDILDSTKNIYYVANTTPALLGADYLLGSGGYLLATWVPEPAAGTLLLVAIAGLLARRRGRHAGSV